MNTVLTLNIEEDKIFTDTEAYIDVKEDLIQVSPQMYKLIEQVDNKAKLKLVLSRLKYLSKEEIESRKINGSPWSSSVYAVSGSVILCSGILNSSSGYIMSGTGLVASTPPNPNPYPFSPISTSNRKNPNSVRANQKKNNKLGVIDCKRLILGKTKETLNNIYNILKRTYR